MDKRIQTSKINGLKGGRPKGSLGKSTLNALAARAWFAEQVHKNIEPIFNMLLAKASEGDVGALRELLDRAWGRAPQAIDVTSQGEKIIINDRVMDIAKRFEQELKKSI